MATLATLIVKLTADAGGFLGEMEKTESRTSKLLGGIGKSAKALGVAAVGGLGVAAGAAGGLGIVLTKLAVDAAPLENVRHSFDGLAESAGRGGDEMLAALEKGSSGMIAQRDLMMSFNKAAQLVGQDFAVQLPEAMGYLGKVAASTGQDMGFMLDSLVLGVGRLSPMILDNLGIQVTLSDATARAAEMFGMEAEELTKTQTQAGMTAVVLEKLQANTAAMPDVSDSAAAGLARMRAQFQNLKDQIGMAMLPALQALLEPLAGLAQEIGPQVITLTQRLGTWLGEKLPVAISYLTGLLSGELPGAFGAVLSAGQAVASWFIERWPQAQATFLAVWEVISATALTVAGIFQNQVLPPFREAFANLTEALGKLGLDWGDVWGAIGRAVVIVAVVIGAAILGIVGVLTAIITTMASVAEHVTSTWSNIAGTFMAGLEAISKIVGGAMAIIRGVFTGDLDLIRAGVQAFIEGHIGMWKAMGQGVINAIQLIFGTIINAVTTFISTFINFFVGLADTLVGGSIIQDMMDSMLEIIQSMLASIVGAIVGFIADVIDAFSGLAEALYDIGASIMEGLKAGIVSKVQDIVSTIRGIIEDILNEAREVLDIFSPSGVFVWIGEQMMEGLALGIAGATPLPAAAAAGAAQSATYVTNNYFSQTVHTRATSDITVQSFEAMRAMVG